MKVLFVHSGNSELFPVSPFLRSQALSLEAKGVEVVYFPVMGHGTGYLRNIVPLRRCIKAEAPDIIHAHYSLCGWVAALAFAGKPLILSLMGDDAQGTFSASGRRKPSSLLFVLLTIVLQPFMDAIIFKAPDLGKVVWRKRIAHWLPNGVRMEQFELQGAEVRSELGLDPLKKHVVFLGSVIDPNKNIALARDAIALLGRSDTEFHAVHGVPHETVVKYLNGADVLLLCSFSEGSPNVIKEAMTCNCPIVTTPAGDAEWVIGDTAGCFVALYDARDFADKIALALDHPGRTKGRERILALGLDADSIADRLIGIYRSVIQH